MPAEQVTIPTLDQVLLLTTPMGVDREAYSEHVEAISELGRDFSVEELALGFEDWADGVLEPPYGPSDPLENPGVINRPTIEKSGIRGKGKDGIQLQVKGNYNMPEVQVAEYVSTFPGPSRSATLTALYLQEEGQDPAVLTLKLAATRQGGYSPRHPSILWTLHKLNLATGETMLDESSGTLMEKGRKGMRNVSRPTPDKSIIFKLGLDAVQNFDGRMS